jgi:hypothetical protein
VIVPLKASLWIVRFYTVLCHTVIETFPFSFSFSFPLTQDARLLLRRFSKCFFITLFSQQPFKVCCRPLFNPLQAPMARISSFSLLLLVGFNIKTTHIGWTGYVCFCVMWPEAFLAAVCLVGFLPLLFVSFCINLKRSACFFKSLFLLTLSLLSLYWPKPLLKNLPTFLL